jgi:hypothetical protein
MPNTVRGRVGLGVVPNAQTSEYGLQLTKLPEYILSNKPGVVTPSRSLPIFKIALFFGSIALGVRAWNIINSSYPSNTYFTPASPSTTKQRAFNSVFQ